jgi:hypothetical protein
MSSAILGRMMWLRRKIAVKWPAKAAKPTTHPAEYPAKHLSAVDLERGLAVNAADPAPSRLFWGLCCYLGRCMAVLDAGCNLETNTIVVCNRRGSLARVLLGKKEFWSGQ